MLADALVEAITARRRHACGVGFQRGATGAMPIDGSGRKPHYDISHHLAIPRDREIIRDRIEEGGGVSLSIQFESGPDGAKPAP